MWPSKNVEWDSAYCKLQLSVDAIGKAKRATVKIRVCVFICADVEKLEYSHASQQE